MWYAHTRKGLGKDQWELLRNHLAAVAEAARQHGCRFGGGELASLAGQIHDLGKYSLDFQKRLEGLSHRVDHSTAGAVWAQERLPGPWGRMLAHVVAGHHAGLQDDLLAFDGRLAAKRSAMPPAEQAARADGVVLPGSVAGPRLLGQNAGFIQAFLTRMVFSCLLDADRSETAQFVDGEEEAVHPDLPTLEAELARWMAAQQHEATPLNAVRAAVLEAALAKATAPPGVFTLTVPTGGGKTLASLAFALAHARANRLDRVVVVIPFTSIIEQTAAVYRTALGAFGAAVLEHHSAFERDDEAAWSADRVGPERLLLCMQRWDNPVVVTTAVQFFESLFASRPSRCRKLHSLARSVIIVDEAQTMPLPLLRPCVSALWELAHNYGASVVLCTATQPALNADGPRPFDGGFRKTTELADVPGLFSALRRVILDDRHEAVGDAALAGFTEAVAVEASRARDAVAHGLLVAGDLGLARHVEGGERWAMAALPVSSSTFAGGEEPIFDDEDLASAHGKPCREQMAIHGKPRGHGERSPPGRTGRAALQAARASSPARSTDDGGEAMPSSSASPPAPSSPASGPASKFSSSAPSMSGLSLSSSPALP